MPCSDPKSFSNLRTTIRFCCSFVFQAPSTKYVSYSNLSPNRWSARISRANVPPENPNPGNNIAFEPMRGSSRNALATVSYTHLRAHETRHDLVCRLLLEKKK